MSVRQVEVRGCVPTLVAVVLVAALLATVVGASAALLAVALVAGAVAGIVRWVRAKAGGPPRRVERRRASDVTLDGEWVERSEDREGGPPRLDG